MITIKEFYGDVKDIDESVLAVKSDCLWEKGSLLDIKNLVTPQLFYLNHKVIFDYLFKSSYMPV